MIFPCLPTYHHLLVSLTVQLPVLSHVLRLAAEAVKALLTQTPLEGCLSRPGCCSSNLNRLFRYHPVRYTYTDKSHGRQVVDLRGAGVPCDTFRICKTKIHNRGAIRRNLGPRIRFSTMVGNIFTRTASAFYYPRRPS